MKTKIKNKGSVLLIVVFTIVLLTAFVVGMLQINSEQIQIMKNEIFTAQARAIAEAGIAHAFSRLRTNSSWRGPDTNDFGNGSYTVIATGPLPVLDVNSTGISAQSFVSRVKADITVGSTKPYKIRINKLKVNQ